MNSQEQFYAMIHGAIGTVSYKWKTKDKTLSSQEEQKFIDDYVREAMNVLLTKARYSYENILPPNVAYFNARQEARRILNDMGPSVEIKSESLQVGNKECLEYVFKIQQDLNFMGWVNPSLVELYVKTTQEILNQTKN